MDKLTVKQENVLDFLKKSIANNGYPPTVREVCKAMGLRSPRGTYSCHLGAQDKPYLSSDCLF